MPETQNSVEKRKVTMTNAIAVPGDAVHTHVATDYVPVDQLEEYVADARTRWQLVEVGAEADNGPGDNSNDSVGE